MYRKIALRSAETDARELAPSVGTQRLKKSGGIQWRVGPFAPTAALISPPPRATISGPARFPSLATPETPGLGGSGAQGGGPAVFALFTGPGPL